MEETIRDIINEYRDEIYTSGELWMPKATQYMVELSALMGNISEEIATKERAYMVKLNSIIEDKDMSVARAEILAKTSDEYYEYKIAKDYNIVVLEMIRALKYRCRALANEEEASHTS